MNLDSVDREKMSSSSRLYSETDSSRVDLPVFLAPTELIFTSTKRRCLLTVFNPYGNEAHFRIMTTSPERFDVSTTKGTIKPNRRIDITIRILSQKFAELPEPTDEPQTIDYFRITLQVGQLKGNKPVKVHWCNQATEFLDTEESSSQLLGRGDACSKYKIIAAKSPTNSTLQVTSSLASTGTNRSLSCQRPATNRPGRSSTQIDHPHSSSNVNLICAICAIACVFTLFMPLSSDSELCKKAKSIQDQAPTQTPGLLSQLASILSRLVAAIETQNQCAQTQ